MAQPSSIGSRAIRCVAEVGLAGNIRVDEDEPAPTVLAANRVSTVTAPISTSALHAMLPVFCTS
jgi:hypothetical protein